ncbi:hypothetical protein K4F52_004422 [Lecanicillium sp. MT-2017a]|nr:hypothetical protein K4F52_004422 [Lecanicillium sp. MT-2017a]
MVRIAFAALLTFVLSVYAVGDPSGEKNVGNGNGGQFITGRCLSDADCASGCCAGLQDGAVCSARLAATENGKQGCGFGGAGAGAGGAGAGGGAGNQDQNQNNGGNGGNGGNGSNCARAFQA